MSQDHSIPLIEDSDDEYEPQNNDINKITEKYVSKDGKFRFCASSVFLTYPQCNLSIHQVMDFLLSKKANVLVVAQEHHQDGNPHIHAYAEFKTKVDTKTERYFDFKGFHPNIAKPISKFYVIRYITKKKDFEEYNIDVQKFLDEEKKKIKQEEKKSKGKMKKVLTEVIHDEITPAQAVAKEPMLLLYYDKIKRNYEMWKCDIEEEERQSNLFTNYIFKRKKRHYWIFGRSNTGKTSFISDYLKIAFPGDIFQIPKNNDWVAYSGEHILYCDEYKGQLTIQELNQICDGGNPENPKYNRGLQLNTKGSSKFLKVKPIVFIFSNYDIIETYKVLKDDNHLRGAVLNRFNLINWDSYWGFDNLMHCRCDEDYDIDFNPPQEIEYWEPTSI